MYCFPLLAESLKKPVPSLFGQPIYLLLAALLNWDSLSLIRANLCQVALLDLLCTTGEVCPAARDTCTRSHWGSCMNTRAGVTSQQLLERQDVVAWNPLGVFRTPMHPQQMQHRTYKRSQGDREGKPKACTWCWMFMLNQLKWAVNVLLQSPQRVLLSAPGCS